MKKFYIVPHSHLDREWYRTLQENRIKLTHFLDELLDTFENENYPFYFLDAQTSFLDDYFDVKPQQKEVFSKYIKNGQLPIGPWYVQPDEQLPTAEGIIRNLLVSKKISDEYTDFAKIGYLPDSFGQSGALPTLLKGFGIEKAMFYRGLAETDSKYNDFIWEGYDGSKVLATWLPIGYGNGMFLSDNLQDNIKVIEENIELLEHRNVSKNFLLMCGSDQSAIKKYLPKAVAELNEYYKDENYVFELASPIDYMNEIIQHTASLDTVKGELRKGKNSRTHNSIGGTRMDIKITNHSTEKKFLNLLEPLDALCSLYGLGTDKELISRGWKYIVESHAHDSICTCCTDPIHKEIEMRYMYANQLADFLILKKFNELTAMVNFNTKLGRPILVFSSFLKSRKSKLEVDVYTKTKDFKIVDKNSNEIEYTIKNTVRFNLKDTKVSFTPLPDDWYDKVTIDLNLTTDGCGYDSIYLIENQKPTVSMEIVGADNFLENEFIKINVQDNGLLTIIDKNTNLELVDQLCFVNGGNAGDEYDYSPPRNDLIVKSTDALVSSKLLYTNNIEAKLQLVHNLKIPITCNNDERSSELEDYILETSISLRKDDSKIYFQTKILNNSENHRTQVFFNMNKKVDGNISYMQLGEIKRNNYFEQTQDSIKDKWHEKLYPIFPQHNYSGLKDQDNGIVILNKGLPQYEVIEDANTNIAVTLSSSCGVMGNENLLFRPGRRSGTPDLTPDSQMIGELIVDYAFMFTSNENYILESESYVNELVGFTSPEIFSEGHLPDNLLLASTENDLITTTFKVAENSSDIIFRFLNPNNQECNDTVVKFNRFSFSTAQEVNLAETEIKTNSFYVKNLNNPDRSDREIFSGKVIYSKIPQNSLHTVKLGK